MRKPTVGDSVHYRAFFPKGWPTGSTEERRPLHAVVAFVHNERRVNLTVHEESGNTYGQPSVLLLQDGEERPPGISYCEWPTTSEP